MSRGISDRQRQILGIAVHVNRLSQGGAPMVHTDGLADIYWPLVAHLLDGLPFLPLASIRLRGYMRDGGYYFAPGSPATESARYSVGRALRSLVERKLLVERTGYPLVVCHGYVLTDAGLEAGLLHERPVEPSLVFRSGQILRPEKIRPSTWAACCEAFAAEQVSLHTVHCACLAVTGQWTGEADVLEAICGRRW